MSLTCPVFVRETVPALFSLAVALAVVALVVNPVTAADATLKKGDRIVFLGDSITQVANKCRVLEPIRMQPHLQPITRHRRTVLLVDDNDLLRLAFLNKP